MRRAAAVLILLGFMAVPAAANADGPGRCYPPPCPVEAPGDGRTGSLPAMPPNAVVGASTAEDRSPAPYVAIGLTGVMGSLAVVALRRRSTIVRGSQVRPAPAGWTVSDAAPRRRVLRGSSGVPREGAVHPDGVTIT